MLKRVASQKSQTFQSGNTQLRVIARSITPNFRVPWTSSAQ